MPGNHEQVTTWAKERGDILGGLRAKRCGQNLKRIRFKHKIKLTAPMCGRLKQIGRVIFDAGTRESLAAGANRGLGDVKGSGAKAPLGKLLRIVTEAATGNESGFSLSLQ